MIVVLAGGVGAAKFLSGLVDIIPQDEVTVVANTGDDARFYDLHVSPDLDIVMYTLAGIVDSTKGWGIRDDTFACLAALGRLGRETWFQLGDRDLATHIWRTELLRTGFTLTEATSRIGRAFGVRAKLLPMSDERVETRIVTPAGTLSFQEYMVRRRATDPVNGVFFAGVAEAAPAPGVLQAIADADGVIVAPSNPIISIGTILAVQGIREALHSTKAPVAAISPIVAGRALKGPADLMLKGLGHESSAAGVAGLYKDFVDIFVLDRIDSPVEQRIQQLGMRTVITDTIMADRSVKQALARTVLEELGGLN